MIQERVLKLKNQQLVPGEHLAPGEYTRGNADSKANRARRVFTAG